MEIERSGFVCDAIREDGLVIEVQTGSFGPIRKKLKALAAEGPVHLVHPIAFERTIELRDTQGNLVRSRKSPSKGSPYDLFKALVYAPELPLVPNLEIEIVYIREIEHRVDDGKGSWRRKGISKKDRELAAILATERFPGAKAFTRFIPAGLPEEFTAQELAKAAKIRSPLARKAVYVLSRLEVLQETGKRGNAKLYTRTPQSTGGSEP